MILQLNPSLPVITPKGKAIAHAIIDSGIENDLQWVCFQDSTGECWTWKNPDIRSHNKLNWREYISPFYNPEDVKIKNTDSSFCNYCGNRQEECDCENDGYDYKAMYNHTAKELLDCKKSLSELKQKNKESLCLLRDLYNDDKIYPTCRPKVSDYLLCNCGLKFEMHSGRIILS